jgi:hypothetical protein
MKEHVLLLVAAVGLLSGCLVYDDPYRDGGDRYSDHNRYGGSDQDRYRNRDRDHDGVPNRQDRRPDDPARY